MKLCTYSRSDLLSESILAECPIRLNREEHERCPCRKRVHLMKGRTELRVLSCTWPRKWNGEEIVNPPAFAEATRRRITATLESERLMAKLKTATPPVRAADPAPLESLAAESEVTAVVPAEPTPSVAECCASAPAKPAKRWPHLAAALAAAQQKCRAAANDRKNAHHGYRYTSAEAVIEEAKSALADTGLALAPIELSLGENGREMHRKFLLIHESGESLPLVCVWPVEVEKGRPLDKATAIAATLSLSYLLRDLLLMPRVKSEDELAARKEPPTPSARDIRAQKAAQAAAPSSPESKAAAVTQQQLDKLLALRVEVISLLKPEDEAGWWREDILAKWAVKTARDLSEAQAREMIAHLHHLIQTSDLEAGMKEGAPTGRQGG